MRIILVDKMYRTLLDELGIQEEAIVFDTTGFSPTQASLHYLARSGGRYEKFIKGAYAVGIRSQFILSATSGIGPASDTGYLEPLRRKSRRYARGRPWIVIADRGFDSVHARETDLIPPIRRNNVLKRPDRIVRFELVSLLDWMVCMGSDGRLKLSIQ